MATYTVDGVDYDVPEGMDFAKAVRLIHGMQKGSSDNSGVATYSNSDPTTDPSQLQFNTNWLDASRKLYEYNNGASFDGNDKDLAEWGLDQMGWFNYNMPSMAVDAVRIKQAPDDVKQSFLHLMDTYDNLSMSWGGAGRFIKGAALDPTTYVGLGTFGIGTVASGGAKLASKEALKELIVSGVRTGIEGSIQAGVADAIQQSVRIDAGAQEGFDTGQLAKSAGTGFALGGALGAAAPVVGKVAKAGKEAVAEVFARDGSETVGKAGDAGSQASKVDTEATPVVGTEANPAFSDRASKGETVPDPDPTKAPTLEVQPEGGLAVAVEKPFGKATDGEQLELFPELKVEAETGVKPGDANASNGEQLELFPELKVASEGKAEPLNVGKRLTDNPVYEAITRMANDDGGRTFPTSPSDIAKAVKDPLKILNATKPEDITATIESLRRAYTTGQERQLIDQAIQAATEKLLQRNADLTRRLQDQSLSLAERSSLLAERNASYDTEQALRLADLDQSSMAGANLGSRAGLVNTGEFRAVSVDSILREKLNVIPSFATPQQRAEASNEFYRLASDRQEEAVRAAKAIDLQSKIQIAYDNGDFATAQLRHAEFQAITGTPLGKPSVSRYLTEYMISNVFSLKSVMVNSVPHVLQAVFRPGYEAALKGLDGKAVTQMLAQYNTMANTMSTALQAAVASFRYEKGLISGKTQFVESSQALKKMYGGGILRIFPRLNGAVDEFFGQLNYRSYVASEAAGMAYDAGKAQGLTGDALQSFVKTAYLDQVEKSFSPNIRAVSVMDFLRREGISRGYSGAKLDNWVVEELNKNQTLFREATNQTGLNFVDDLAFKRDFRGQDDAGSGYVQAQVSGMAKHYEEFVNRNPWFRLAGQLFFRTPVRVFEEGFRLTAGLNLVTPGFLRDLTGKGFGGTGGYAQLRAQGELMLSYAIAMAAMYEYSQGNLHGSGEFGLSSWRIGRQKADDPEFEPYSLKLGDTRWNFRNFDPLSTPLKIMANALDGLAMLQTRRAQGEDVSKHENETLAYLSVATLSIGQSIKDASLMEGISQLTKLGQEAADPDSQSQAIWKFINQKAASLIPFGSQVNKLSAQVDPVFSDPLTLEQYIEGKVMPWANTVPKRYDALGYPVKSANPTAMLYGFPDLTSQADRDATYVSPEHREALHGIAQVGLLTNTNFVAPYDGAKFSKSDIPYLQNLAGTDLRTLQTHDGLETWYDRAQRYVREAGIAGQIASVARSNLPTGTPSAKGAKVDTIAFILQRARERALLRLLNEENATSIDKYREKLRDKALGMSGQHDLAMPF